MMLRGGPAPVTMTGFSGGLSQGHSRRRADQDPEGRSLLPTGVLETGHKLQERLKKNEEGCREPTRVTGS